MIHSERYTRIEDLLMEGKSPNATGRPQSGAAEPIIKRFRPPAEPAKPAAAGTRPAPSGESAPPPSARASSPAATNRAGERPAASNRAGWTEQLTAEAEKNRDPLAGLLTAVCGDLYDAMARVSDSAQKVCGTLPHNPADALKLNCVSADKQSAVAKQIYNYLQFLDRLRQRQGDPLRRPVDRGQTGGPLPRE